MVRLFVHEPESGALIHAPRRPQHALSPERHLPVLCLASEANALVDQPSADPHVASGRLHVEQTQLRNRLRLPDGEYRPNDVALRLGDPAALSLWIVMLREVRRDLRDEHLELFVPAVLLMIERAVAMHDPSH